MTPRETFMREYLGDFAPLSERETFLILAWARYQLVTELFDRSLPGHMHEGTWWLTPGYARALSVDHATRARRALENAFLEAGAAHEEVQRAHRWVFQQIGRGDIVERAQAIIRDLERHEERAGLAGGQA